jgi:hypothetical protein
MKYLFIFLPFFAMAQGGDSTLYGVRFDSIITHDNFLATPNSSGALDVQLASWLRNYSQDEADVQRTIEWMKSKKQKVDYLW